MYYSICCKANKKRKPCAVLGCPWVPGCGALAAPLDPVPRPCAHALARAGRFDIVMALAERRPARSHWRSRTGIVFRSNCGTRSDGFLRLP